MSLTKIYKFILPCLMVVLAFLFSAQLVFAQTGVDKAKEGLKTTGTGGFGVSGEAKLYPAGGLAQIIGNVIGAILAFVGVIFFCLILWAGFGWMTARGKEEEISKAKDTIFGAVLGLMVVLGAYAVTRLIAVIFSNALTGT
ncbi:MAG: hypothetical protein Q7K35_02770 [bacterium]|nr:hypothetical protein [bacterium]